MRIYSCLWECFTILASMNKKVQFEIRIMMLNIWFIHQQIRMDMTSIERQWIKIKTSYWLASLFMLYSLVNSCCWWVLKDETGCTTHEYKFLSDLFFIIYFLVVSKYLLRKAFPNFDRGLNCFLGSTTRAFPGMTPSVSACITAINLNKKLYQNESALEKSEHISS